MYPNPTLTPQIYAALVYSLFGSRIGSGDESLRCQDDHDRSGALEWQREGGCVPQRGMEYQCENVWNGLFFVGFLFVLYPNNNASHMTCAVL